MKLKLSDIIALSKEIHGIPQKFPGLLYEDIDYPVKLNIHRLHNEIDSEVKAYGILMDEILKKHGTLKDGRMGSYSIGPQNLPAYFEDKKSLEDVEKEIDISVLFTVDISIDTLSDMGKTTGFYPVFQSIIEHEKKKSEAAVAEAKPSKPSKAKSK